ncbi:MAG: iron-regulated protein, partial [Bacteroidota bacterium]
GTIFYHMNGSYHSDDKEGILWYVAKGNPDLTLKNISVVEQDDISALSEDYKGKADIIIVVPSSMTKTYLTGFE